MVWQEFASNENYEAIREDLSWLIHFGLSTFPLSLYYPLHASKWDTDNTGWNQHYI